MNMIDIDRLSEKVPKADDEYIGQDGLIHCAKCGDRLQTIINPMGMGERKVRCICSCMKAKRDAEEQNARKEAIERNRRICFRGSKQRICTFEKSTETEYLTMAKNYAKNFQQFRADGKGLLLYGTVGTGKSHMAACIANYLIDEGFKAYMTNFASMVNHIQSSFEGRQEYIDGLNRYDLIIIDDLGAERRSEFMQEQVFNIIDSRYASGFPMIITTNLTAEEMKKPSDIGNSRIYDRILERCHPVEVKGHSIRRKHLKDDYWETENLLKGLLK